jgi:SAM-dependent methyltransferase
MWDERFSEPGWAYGTEPNDFLVSVADRIPLGRVLCIAEGEGRNAVYLAGLGHRVTAVDASPVGLAKARALAEERGVEITTVEADLADFTIEPGSWNGIVSVFCHMPPPLMADVHSRCVLGLAAHGVLVLEGFAPRQLELGTGGPKSRELLYGADDLRRRFDGLDVEILRELDRELDEGRYHTGTAAVVQVLGRKPELQSRSQGPRT